MDNNEVMDAVTLRKERNKIACRKSRQKKGERLRELEHDTKKMEEQYSYLLQRLQEVTDSQPHQEHTRSRRFRILRELIAAVQEHNFGPVLHYFHPECITIKDKCKQFKGSTGFFSAWEDLYAMYSSIQFSVKNIQEVDPHCDQVHVTWSFSGIVTETALARFNRNLVVGKSVELSGASYFIFNADRLIFVNMMWSESTMENAAVALTQ